MTASMDIFHARIGRITSGAQIVGEGLDHRIHARRSDRRKAKRRSGGGLLALVVVCGGFGGAYAFGQLPAPLAAQIAEMGSQAQNALLGLIEPAVAQAGQVVAAAG